MKDPCTRQYNQNSARLLALESRYLDKPIHPAMLNEASENETAIVGVGTLPHRKGKENENSCREEIVLLRCTVPIRGATPSSEVNYTVMSLSAPFLTHCKEGGAFQIILIQKNPTKWL